MCGAARRERPGGTRRVCHLADEGARWIDYPEPEEGP
jgi:hypothetical protein